MTETIRCAACGRECEPVNDSDAPVTCCVDCAAPIPGDPNSDHWDDDDDA